MINSVIFAFGHKMRSGKGEVVAEIIKQRSGTGPSIKKYSFANALKREIDDLAKECGGMHELFLDMGFPEWVTYDPVAPMNDPMCPLGKQRLALQYWGVHRREQDADYWVKQVAKQMEIDRADIALLDDLRFPNEFTFCKTFGECVKIVRPDLPPNDHISETALDHLPDSAWGSIIVNDGSLADLQRKAVETFDELMDRVPQLTEQGASIKKAV